ncbi:MAG: hypothetical protein GTO18_12350, partial [Anaerolineales bacterium]|nr:hypothetical protein [Anaerolineales bacterium]
MTNMIREPAISDLDWQADNQAFLELEMQWLRLLLHRRILWLRKQWQQDEIQPYQGWVITDSKADWILAGEDFDAEMNFYCQDPVAASLTEKIELSENALADRLQAMVEGEMPPAIDILSMLFGLSSFERHTLLLCLAPMLDQSFEQLFAYVQDDVNRKYPTPYLSLTLFQEREADIQLIRDAFMPYAPLRRFRLLTLGNAPEGTAPGARPMYLDERIAAYL